MTDNYLHADVTAGIINAFYKVYNTLGYGFLEKVYQHALVIEVRRLGLSCHAQFPVEVFYDGYRVGAYMEDLIVEDKVIVELKAPENLCEQHEAQLVNYLKATELEVGLLLNFGKQPQFKRKVFSSAYKPHNKSSRS